MVRGTERVERCPNKVGGPLCALFPIILKEWLGDTASSLSAHVVVTANRWSMAVVVGAPMDLKLRIAIAFYGDSVLAVLVKRHGRRACGGERKMQSSKSNSRFAAANPHLT